MDKRTLTQDDKRDLEAGLETRYRAREITAHDFQVGLQDLGWGYEDARSKMLEVQAEILKSLDEKRSARRNEVLMKPPPPMQPLTLEDYEAKRDEQSKKFLDEYLKR